MEYAKFEVVINPETGYPIVEYYLLNGEKHVVDYEGRIPVSGNFATGVTLYCFRDKFCKLYNINWNVFCPDELLLDDKEALQNTLEKLKELGFLKNVPEFKHHHHAVNFLYTKFLGGQPKKINRIIRGKLCDFYSANIDKKIIRLAMDGKPLIHRGMSFKLNMDKLHKVWKYRDLLMQTLKDGNEHLLPVVFEFNQDTHALKKRFGKSLWKKVCKNSFTRNKLLVDTSRSCMAEVTFEQYVQLDIPSTLLKVSGNAWQGKAWAKNAYKGRYAKTLTQRLNYFSDVMNFKNYEYGSKEFKDALNWSHRRLLEEHEDMVRQQRTARYSSEEFKYMALMDKGLCSHFKREDNDDLWEAVLLRSEMEVGQEGYYMNHCVGGYAKACTLGRYLVYSIRKNGERYSTLGIEVGRIASSLPTYKFQQHYMYNNHSVPKESIARELQNTILTDLNLLVTMN